MQVYDHLKEEATTSTYRTTICTPLEKVNTYRYLGVWISLHWIGPCKYSVCVKK